MFSIYETQRMGGVVVHLVITLICLKYATAENKLWHSYQFGTGTGNREELVITDLKLNSHFNYGKNVTNWISLSLDDRSYAVGYTASKVVLVTAKLNETNEFNFSSTTVVSENNDTVRDAILLKEWNANVGEYKVLLVTTIESNFFTQLKWFDIGRETNTHIWTWKLHEKIFYLTHKEIHGTTKLFTVAQHDDDSTFLNVFDFSLKTNFWLSQRIELEYPTKMIVFKSYNGNTFLSITQKQLNMVFVFKYFEGHFVSYQNITRQNISSLTSFRIGSNAYLAIGGSDSAIFRFTRNGLVREFIPGFNEEQIEMWFPVPVKTYRDEVLIIIQRHIYHSETHDSLTFEALVFNGRHFIFHDEMTCLYFGEELRGLSCLDEKGEKGISGAAILSVGNKIGILIPKSKGPSEFFQIDMKLKPLPSPVDIEVQNLKALREKLEKIISKSHQNVEQDDILSLIKAKSRADTDDFETADASNNNKNELNNSTNKEEVKPGGVTVEDISKQLSMASQMIKEIRDKLKNVVRKDQKEIHVRELIINGPVEVHGHTNARTVFVNKINNEPAHAAFNDIVSIENIGPITGPKTFTNVEVENITFNLINNIEAKNIVFNDGNPLVVRGDIIFKNPVVVQKNIHVITRKINDIVLENEIVRVNSTKNGTIKFKDLHVNKLFFKTLNGKEIEWMKSENSTEINEEKLVLENLHIKSNLSVLNINGINFNDFVGSLCFKNKECRIDGNVHIDGVIRVSEAEIGTLNNLKFPDEYLFKNSRDFLTVTGSKTFLDTLTVNEVNINGKLNGIDPKTILTLSTNQSLPGKFIFSNMKVLEKITVNGKIIGPHITDLLTNPTLLEVNETKSNINFKQLEVHGNIVILDTLNGKPFQDLLGDVIYQDDKEADIVSLKAFPEGFTVDRGLTIKSNAISGIPLDAFVTKDTEQDLVFSTLNGDVVIENLLLTGFYGGLNISKMAEEAVRLSGEQFVSGELIFENNDPNLIDIASKEIEIVNFLNGESIETILSSNEGVIQSFDESSDIRVDVLEVRGSLESKKLNVDLENIAKNRLSITQNQEIDFPFTINASNVAHIEAHLINGIPYNKLFDPNHYINFITTQLVSGRLRIEEMEVDNLKVGTINDVNLNMFMVNNDFSFLNVSFGKNLVILGDVSMKRLAIKYFNNVPFELFSRNIVYKDEEIVTLTGFKNYLNGLRVREKMFTDSINGIPIDDILTKNDLQNVASPLHIYGNVLITTDCEIKETLNNVSLKYLKEAFRIQNGVFIIRDNVSFEHETHIDHLHVDGPINHLSFEHITSEAGGAFENSNYFNNVTFKDTVHIRGNLTVSNYINEINLNDFLDSIAFKNINSEINGLVIFKEPVEIAETLFSNQNLISRYVNDIDLQKWQKEAVYVNKGYISSHITFDDVFVRGDLRVEYLNDINMKKVVLTKTDEDLYTDLDVGQAIFFNDVPVSGLVNGRILQEEFRESLLVSGNQEITSAVTFHGAVSILGNLDIHKPVNGQNLNRVVTIATEQNLTGDYVFDNDVEVLRKFLTSESINDIDFDEWHEHSLKKYQNGTQNIYNEWVIKGEVNFNADVDGTGLLAGLDIVKMANELRQMKNDFSEKHLEVVDATRSICKDVNYVLAAARKQIYFFNYFEQLKGIILSTPIDTVHHFTHLNQHYLLITEINSCKSDMFKWENSEFVYINTIETGKIEQIASIYDHKFLLLVTNTRINSNCTERGTFVWEFDNDNLIQLHTLPEHSQIQQSLRPRTFYGLTIGESEVIEYYAAGSESIDIKRLTKWKGKWSQNAKTLNFFPRGLGTGLAVYDYKTLYRLLRVNIPRDEFYDYNYEAIEVGTIITQDNCCLPPLSENSDMETIHVGHGDSRKTMVAIASHEETSVKGKWDNIKIYEDILNGKVFHKISTYKPSSLVNIEFGNNGESLLAFLENQQVLQVYEYKGIEGFQNRLSKKIRGRQLLHFSVQENEEVERKLLLVIGRKKVHVLEAITEGNQLRESDVEC